MLLPAGRGPSCLAIQGCAGHPRPFKAVAKAVGCALSLQNCAALCSAWQEPTQAQARPSDQSLHATAALTPSFADAQYML